VSKLRPIAAVKVRFRGSRIISALGRKRAMLVPPNVAGNRRAAPTLMNEKACAGASG